MGFLDTVFGRTKPLRPNLDALFALPSAAVTLEVAAGLVPTGRAGLCWKPPAGQSAHDVAAEIAELLGPHTGSPEPPVPAVLRGRDAEDAYGYRWVLLEDPDIESLVTNLHLVNAILTEHGWGPQLLCSVVGLFPGPEAAADLGPCFLVYLFKRGTFYPFAPVGPERRDHELELRIRSLIGDDLPIETDLSRWFALWDMPLR